MTILQDYTHFAGNHWETGSVHNYFAYQNIPVSEQLLLGVSGGIVFGYFTFHYEGWDPQLALLTRNTFDPFDTMLSRLGIQQTIKQTTNPDKARQNLINALKKGTPAIVWADTFTLMGQGRDDLYGMMPVLVYGYDGETAWVADRANVPFQYPADLFDQARGRVKRYKHRLITLSPPDPAKTESAIIDGIRQTIAIFTEKPPKGSPKNFGFKAYDAWIEYLTNPKSPKSWVKQFPAGRPFFCALLDLFDRTAAFGQAQAGADRHTYATFLEEASVALGNPQLEDAALYWHASSVAWSNLLEYTLPFSEHMPPDEFRLARELLTERRDRFYAEGQSARERIIEIDTQIDELKSRMETDFPLDEVSFKKLQTIMIKLVTDIRNVEMEGIESLQNALS